ncbi:MAG: DUF5107 domain-containing protein [Anaerolineae bacterium]|nr:DUF5107 domain-containing protein [Anaerolineae bacterium]
MRWRCLGFSLVFCIVLGIGWGLGTSQAKAQNLDGLESSSYTDRSVNLSYTATVFYTTTIVIPTYPYAAYLTEGYNAIYNMTYPVLDWAAYNASNPAPISQTYTLLVLENVYLKVTVMPELGGRVYQLIDKSSGHNHLYQNPVIKPTGWGPPEQGWWLAVGGIEWCLPVEEHGYEWGVPWQWSVVTSTAGVTVTVRDTDTEARLRAAIDLFLPSDQAALQVTPHLENLTGAPIDYKFWVNAALAPGAANRLAESLEFIFNAPQMTVHSSGDDRLPYPATGDPTGPDYQFDWPVYKGVDYSHLRNWRQWLGFFEYPQATKDFVGLYNHDADVGVMRIFPHKVARGAKGFAVGWGEDALPSSLWTDDDSGGVEIHGGVAPTFWDTARLTAGQTLSWTELWYPVQSLEEVVVATAEAALSVQVMSATLHIGALPTRAHDESFVRVWNRTDCSPLVTWSLSATTPITAYQNTLPIGNLAPEQIAVAYLDDAGALLAGFQVDGCLDTPLAPTPHLAYGLNVRDDTHIKSLFEPVGFEWIKLWEEYSGLPTERLSSYVLYILDCRGYINDMNAWRAHVEQVAQAGLGLVEAYEICNEPNVYGFWNNQTPNPAQFVEMLQIAYEEIKAIDSQAFVISGGLAPVGRIVGTTEGWEGNNGRAMDERLYLQAMLAVMQDDGAGMYMDGFGYHPYGFAYAPERDPESVTNGFAFRGTEMMHDILVDAGWPDLPIWATEFNWLRDPAEDGVACEDDATFRDYFSWMRVSTQEQADYLMRAYRFADQHWPWLAGLFTWNLDWYDYQPYLPCEASRYYALRRDDGTDLGAVVPAYTALISMTKRPGNLFAPEMVVTPVTRSLWVALDDLRVITTSFTVSNSGHDTFTWTAEVAPGSLFTPTLPRTSASATAGMQGESLIVAIDPISLPMAMFPGTMTMLWAGTFSCTLNLTTVPTDVVNSPQQVHVILRVVPKLQHIYLPLTLRNYTPPRAARQPHGPSKLGTHAISDGGTTDFVRMVKEGGGHVATVKAVLSIGYLKTVKEISPETVTVARWQDSAWEAVTAEGDPVAQAELHMTMHMQYWSPHKAYVDYWEILNEVDPPSIEGHVWLAQFFMACMDIAEANGYRLALFSYSMGVPEWYEWEAMVETGVFARAKQGGHILALHEYGSPLMQDNWGEPVPLYPGQPRDEWVGYPDRGILAGRYRYLYEDFLIPRDEVIPLVISECNVAIDEPEVRAEYFLEDMFWYDDRLREDDYVIGMHIFTLGGFSGWEHFDYREFLPDMATRVIALQDAP